MFGNEFGQVLRGGQRVMPRRALDLGYEFQHPELDEALDGLALGRAAELARSQTASRECCRSVATSQTDAASRIVGRIERGEPFELSAELGDREPASSRIGR